jgi:hypothetical protein
MVMYNVGRKIRNLSLPLKIYPRPKRSDGLPWLKRLKRDFGPRFLLRQRVVDLYPFHLLLYKLNAWHAHASQLLTDPSFYIFITTIETAKSTWLL